MYIPFDIAISDCPSSKGWSILLVCSLVVEGVVITKDKINNVNIIK